MLAAGKQSPARVQGIAAYDRVSDAKPANVYQTFLLQEQRFSLASPSPEHHPDGHRGQMGEVAFLGQIAISPNISGWS